MNRFAVRGFGLVGNFPDDMAGVPDIVNPSTVSQKPENQINTPVSTDRLLDFVPQKKLRRVDHFSKMALTALFLACEHAGLEVGDCLDSGLVYGTGYGPIASTCGFKDSYIDNGPLGASPTMFTKSVHNQAAANIALQIGLEGPVSTVCQHSFPFQYALLTACLWLQEERVTRVVVGGGDEFAPFFHYCRSRYLSDGDEAPQAMLTDGEVIPGEGAAFFVLENESENPASTISLPTVGRAQELKMLLEKNQYVTPGRLSKSLLSKSKMLWDHNEILQPRNFYGHFPAAAALDLASLMVTVDDRGGICLDGNDRGQMACIEVKE